MINAAVEDYIIPSPPPQTKKTRLNPRNISIKNLVRPITSLSLSGSKAEQKKKENQENAKNLHAKESLRKRGRLGSISASMSAGWDKMKEMTRSILNKAPVVSKLKKAASSYNLSNSSRKSTVESNTSNETLTDEKNIRSLQNKQKSGSIGLFKGSFLRDASKTCKNNPKIQNETSKKGIISTHLALKLPNPNTIVNKSSKPKGRSLSLQNYSSKNSLSSAKSELPTWPRPLSAAIKSDKNTTNSSKDLAENAQRTSDMQDLIHERFPLKNGFYLKYKLKDLLGDGAFGFVFTALSLSDGKEVTMNLTKKVAVKFITKRKVVMDNWVFMRGVEEKVPFEIQLLAYFNHPNIIRYIEHFVDEKYVILITELHGTEWTPLNPVLNSIRNPGLKKLSGNTEHESKVFKGIPKRTSCDLFECIGKSLFC
jgi:hypothetical protein